MFDHNCDYLLLLSFCYIISISFNAFFNFLKIFFMNFLFINDIFHQPQGVNLVVSKVSWDSKFEIFCHNIGRSVEFN